MSNTELPLEFKFKWLDDKGNSTGFLSSKGHFDGEQLVLDKTEIPVSSLAHVENREKRISLGDEKANFLNFMLTRGNPDALVLLSSIHDWGYDMHARFFPTLTVEAFDQNAYVMLSQMKIAGLFLFLIPWIAIKLLGKQGSES